MERIVVTREVKEHGEYIRPTYALGGTTIVHDRARNHAVLEIDGVVVLPVGAEIELTNPNVNAVVTGVRLLAGTKSQPVHVCLDVRVPAEYWGERRELDPVPGFERGVDFWHIQEKVRHTVSSLALREGSVKDRLAFAYLDGLSRVLLYDYSLVGIPQDLRDELMALDQEMTSKPPLGGEGAIVTTVRAMDEEQAREMAQRILRLSNEIVRL